MRVFVFALFIITLSTHFASAQTAEAIDSMPIPKRENFINRIIRYFDESNRNNPSKKFDISIIGGPHYSTDTKFGLGLVASGLYRTSNDSLTPPSNVSISGDITTTGFYKVGIWGAHIAPSQRFRLGYDIYLLRNPAHFWGIGYDNDIQDNNRTKYQRREIGVNLNMQWQPIRNLFIGPSAHFAYIDAYKPADATRWNGYDLRTYTYGIGFAATYDTRDNLTAPTRGLFASIEQSFFPKFMGNNNAFTMTQASISSYRRVWKGGIIAGNLTASFTYGNVPWGMLPRLGGSSSMRGYYEGRYTDRCATEIIVELRQHIWKRSGFAVWIGAGEVFPSLRKFTLNKILPNAGIGYRWEFKRNVNVRLDYGIGRHQSGFIFSINEAF